MFNFFFGVAYNDYVWEVEVEEMVFGGGGKVGLYRRGKAENWAKVGSGESRIAWGCGGYQGSWGVRAPQTDRGYWGTPGKVVFKAIL